MAFREQITGPENWNVWIAIYKKLHFNRLQIEKNKRQNILTFGR